MQIYDPKYQIIRKESKKNAFNFPMKEKIELLAFFTLVLHRRHDGVVIRDCDNLSQKSKELNLHYNTFKRLLNLCLDTGIFYKNNGVVRHRGIVKTLNILEKKSDTIEANTYVHNFDKHFKFFRILINSEKNKNKKFTLGFLKIHIRNQVAMRNYQAQHYLIEKAKMECDLIDKSNSTRHMGKENYKKFKKFYKQASKKGICLKKLYKLNKLQIQKGIITGKHHLSKKTGYSTSTSSKQLIKMEKQGYFKKRTITLNLGNLYKNDLKRIRTMPIEEVFNDSRLKGKYLSFNPYSNNIYSILGSSITISDTYTSILKGLNINYNNPLSHV